MKLFTAELWRLRNLNRGVPVEPCLNQAATEAFKPSYNSLITGWMGVVGRDIGMALPGMDAEKVPASRGDPASPLGSTYRPVLPFWLLTLGGILMLVSPFITIIYYPPPCTGSSCAVPFSPPLWLLLPVAILMPVSGAGSIFLALLLRTGGSKRHVLVGRLSIVLSAIYFALLAIIVVVDASSNNTLGLPESAFATSIGPFLVLVGGLLLINTDLTVQKTGAMESPHKKLSEDSAPSRLIVSPTSEFCTA